MTEYKGFKLRFEKAGKTKREITTFSACPTCGMPMEVTQTWRRGKGAQDMYKAEGICPKGHKLEPRYGYGEAI